MAVFAALLRGVNVGGKNRISMDGLRVLFESLGAQNVVSYIQSGNIIYSSDLALSTNDIEDAILKNYSITTPVVSKTLTELVRAVENNPFDDVDPDLVSIGYMNGPADPQVVQRMDLNQFVPDRVAFANAELYLHLPNGMANSKLPSYVDRRLKAPLTIRNWRTATKLVELALQQPT